MIIDALTRWDADVQRRRAPAPQLFDDALVSLCVTARRLGAQSAAPLGAALAAIVAIPSFGASGDIGAAACAAATALLLGLDGAGADAQPALIDGLSLTRDFSRHLRGGGGGGGGLSVSVGMSAASVESVGAVEAATPRQHEPCCVRALLCAAAGTCMAALRGLTSGSADAADALLAGMAAPGRGCGGEEGGATAAAAPRGGGIGGEADDEADVLPPRLRRRLGAHLCLREAARCGDCLAPLPHRALRRVLFLLQRLGAAARGGAEAPRFDTMLALRLAICRRILRLLTPTVGDATEAEAAAAPGGSSGGSGGSGGGAVRSSPPRLPRRRVLPFPSPLSPAARLRAALPPLSVLLLAHASAALSGVALLIDFCSSKEEGETPDEGEGVETDSLAVMKEQAHAAATASGAASCELTTICAVLSKLCSDGSRGGLTAAVTGGGVVAAGLAPPRRVRSPPPEPLFAELQWRGGAAALLSAASPSPPAHGEGEEGEEEEDGSAAASGADASSAELPPCCEQALSLLPDDSVGSASSGVGSSSGSGSRRGYSPVLAAGDISAAQALLVLSTRGLSGPEAASCAHASFGSLVSAYAPAARLTILRILLAEPPPPPRAAFPPPAVAAAASLGGCVFGTPAIRGLLIDALRGGIAADLAAAAAAGAAASAAAATAAAAAQGSPSQQFAQAPPRPPLLPFLGRAAADIVLAAVAARVAEGGVLRPPIAVAAAAAAAEMSARATAAGAAAHAAAALEGGSESADAATAAAALAESADVDLPLLATLRLIAAAAAVSAARAPGTPPMPLASAVLPRASPPPLAVSTPSDASRAAAAASADAAAPAAAATAPREGVWGTYVRPLTYAVRSVQADLRRQLGEAALVPHPSPFDKTRAAAAEAAGARRSGGGNAAAAAGEHGMLLSRLALLDASTFALLEIQP